MCGIAGAVWTNPANRLTQSDIHGMTESLAHRGPDGQGIHRHEYANGVGFAFGHRRLAIIDIANGQQPMANANESIFVTFNGEIYNYRELRTALEQRGHSFRTNCDTESILHAYEEFGEQFVEYLRGMFAIGLWDGVQQKLILARDRLGEKPLVYSRRNGQLVFASEIKALQRIQGIGDTVNPRAIDQYIRFGYIPHPWTALDGIEKMPPGHLGVYHRDSWSIRSYWNPRLFTDPTISMDEASDRLRQSLDESIRLRMRSDIPVGAFLSGGMDSTVIVGLMKQHSAMPLQTFTLDFPNSKSADSHHAKQFAMSQGTNHRLFTLDANAYTSLEQLIHCFDEPFADSSAIATYFLSAWTSPHVRVILTGDGGDELFGGYSRYHTFGRLDHFDRLPHLAKKFLTGAWLDYLPTFHPNGPVEKLKHRLKVLRNPPSSRYVYWLSHFSRFQREALYHPDYLNSFSFQETDGYVENCLNKYPGECSSIRAMRTDLHTYLPGDILAKIDSTTMAHGLEGRSPFLDHKLVETVCQFPYHLLQQSGLVKPLLGKTFNSLISRDMMKQPKLGFGVPERFWSEPRFIAFANDLLRSQNSFHGNYIRPDVTDRLLREHLSGHINHGERIWSLLSLESWGRRIGENRTSTKTSETPLSVAPTKSTIAK